MGSLPESFQPTHQNRELENKKGFKPQYALIGLALIALFFIADPFGWFNSKPDTQVAMLVEMTKENGSPWSDDDLGRLTKILTGVQDPTDLALSSWIFSNFDKLPREVQEAIARKYPDLVRKANRLVTTNTTLEQLAGKIDIESRLYNTLKKHGAEDVEKILLLYSLGEENFTNIPNVGSGLWEEFKELVCTITKRLLGSE